MKTEVDLSLIIDHVGRVAQTTKVKLAELNLRMAKIKISGNQDTMCRQT